MLHIERGILVKKRIVLFVTILLLGAALIACSNKDKEDSERLDDLEAMIEDVFNDDETDLVQGVTEKEINKLTDRILKEGDSDFNEENEARYEALKDEGMSAVNMFIMEEEVNSLLVDGVLHDELDKSDVSHFAEMLEEYEEKRSVYYERLMAKVDEALDQAETIEEARELVHALFDDEEVSDEVTREREEEALAKVKEILNDQVKNELLNRLEDVDIYLTQLEEETEEEAKKEEERKRSIGEFAGYYKTDEEFPFLCEITQERFDCFVPASDIFSYLKIQEVKDNTGREVTITTEDEETGEVHESTLTMSEDGQTVQANLKLLRLTEEEYKELGGDI